MLLVNLYRKINSISEDYFFTNDALICKACIIILFYFIYLFILYT